MNYIVYWIIVRMVMTSCPSIPQSDKFGRIPTYSSSYDEVRISKSLIAHSIEFNNRDSALLFMSEASTQSDIKGVSLDSTCTINGSNFTYSKGGLYFATDSIVVKSKFGIFGRGIDTMSLVSPGYHKLEKVKRHF